MLQTHLTNTPSYLKTAKVSHTWHYVIHYEVLSGILFLCQVHSTPYSKIKLSKIKAIYLVSSTCLTSGIGGQDVKQTSCPTLAQNPSGNPHSPGNTGPNPTCWGGIERTSQNTAADLCPVVLWPGSSEVLQTPPAYFQPADCAALGPPVESQGRAS